MSRWWHIGATVFAGAFHTVVAAKSEKHLVDQLAALSRKGLFFDEVQFWGHGRPGEVLIDNERISADGWRAIASVVLSKSVVWLRVCSFAGGARGKEACERIASDVLHCRLAAHTFRIGTWASHSGLRVLSPGSRAAWSDDEGGGGAAASHPWAPRTVSAASMTLPSWA